MASVPEILNAAADLLEKPGRWTQGDYARDANGKKVGPNSPDAVCFCTFGAIARVERVAGATASYSVAGGYLYSLLGVPVVVWNDAPERTQAEVVTALRKAAAQASDADQ